MNYLNAAAQYDLQSPREPSYSAEREYRWLCFDAFEAAIESLRASELTHERHVPREHMDAADARARYERLIDLLEELQVEFTDGGRLFPPKDAN